MFLVSEYMNYLEEENELERIYKLKIYYFMFCMLILSWYILNLI